MPVVNVKLSAIKNSFSHVTIDKIIQELPYLGLDIEGRDENAGIIRLEFNPNRPDFSSENGIIRGLRGLFETEIGLPQINNIKPTQYVVQVDEAMRDVRPFIYSFAAKRSNPLTNDEIMQLISMQEDLHNGLGRKRRKASIGIHNLDVLTFPLRYILSDKHKKFQPLDSELPLSIEDVLLQTQTGRTYSYILEGMEMVPLLIDSQNHVVSLPPIVNSSYTRVDTSTSNLLVEVTATNAKYAKQMISILAYELNDMEFSLLSIVTDSPYQGKLLSPDLTPIIMDAKIASINDLLGTNLSPQDIIKCLEKCRCNGSVKDAESIVCTAPSYRGDLFGPQDLCEEVLLGYGIRNLLPDYPYTKLVGEKNVHSKAFEKLRQVMIGLGFIEIVNPSILSETLFKMSLADLDLAADDSILINSIENNNLEMLRMRLYPSMVNTLSVNIHEKYPQKLFEIGKVFKQDGSGVTEGWSLVAAIAHDFTDFSEIKSTLESVMKFCFDIDIQTSATTKPFLLKGHSALVSLKNSPIGCIGEVHPQVLENFSMRTLVSIFEIDLSSAFELLDLYQRRFL
ncbi:MAG: phenylalanine--tRNA ligase subunit beta [Candidatus Nitrosocosmicus sp.]